MNTDRDNPQNVLGSNEQPQKTKPDTATQRPTCDAPDTVYPEPTGEGPHIAETQILGKTYRVIFKGADDNMTMLGSIEYAKQRIFIFNDLPYDQRCETLLHETIHAVNEELKLGLSEVTVARLAVGLHSAGYIRDPGDL